ncbi:phosphate regulon sensor histidine kinase PhoR [Thiofilum flexile]|uniref:phosphate regulon sensor histidine kinase PhoR n=1 Tax=Thiofilum flexile TaxID=125627 RepID=UPI00036CEC63|nr:phosphate regulon sensor histidine kinase PhoR [Thiofilum flexile]
MQVYWSIELRRLVGGVMVAVIFGFITGYWWAAFLVTALGYVAWLLYKLRQLQLWLVHDFKPDELPDSDGVWEQVVTLINRSRQKSIKRKQKQEEILQRLNNIISALPDAVILFDDDHVIQWSNSTALALMGINGKTDVGQRIDNLLRAPEIAQALTGMDTEEEIQFISPRNAQATLQARILPVERGLWLLNVRDISQRIQLQHTRKAFIANASHELRTPLTVVSGYLELMQEDPEVPAHLVMAIQQSREQTLRMQQIISDMLTLSKLETMERAQIPLRVVDVPEMLKNTSQALTDTLAAQSHTLETHIDAELMIMGVEGELTSAITNLIDNAIKHTPAGTHVIVRWERLNQDYAALTVTDNGPGIPNEHIVHLTERFYRVDTGRSRERGGTGLGLSIVKHVIQNHQGYLSIKSRPGETTFQASFPLIKETKEAEILVNT